MLAYPARFAPEPEGGFTVTFRDVPEAVSYGSDLEEALSMAQDALESVLTDYVEAKHALPEPSKMKRGERLVELTPLGAAKAAIYETMRARRIGKASLARMLNCHLPQVDRLLDFCHQTRWEMVEKALASLGKRMVVEVKDAA